MSGPGTCSGMTPDANTTRHSLIPWEFRIPQTGQLSIIVRSWGSPAAYIRSMGESEGLERRRGGRNPEMGWNPMNPIVGSGLCSDLQRLAAGLL